MQRLELQCDDCGGELDEDLICQFCEYASRDDTPELPRGLVCLIYRLTCCKDTPEEAQKEPCACVAASLVERLEGWAAGLVDRSRAKAQ